MPIRVACPSCDSAIGFPDASAGEAARCPECGKKLLVPEKRASRDAGNDEPRPRKKKTKKGGSFPVLWVAIAGAAVLLLAGCGVGGWYAFFRKDPAMGADGWVSLKHKGGVFTAAVPGGRPNYESMGKNPPKLSLPDGKTLKDIIIATEMWGRTDKGREYLITLSTFPADLQSAAARAPIERMDLPFMKVTEDKPVEVNGYKGQRVVSTGKGHTFVSQTYTIGTKYVLRVSVGGDEAMDPADPAVAKFFERAVPNPDAG